MIQEKISIIVPAYNTENYIENTLKSICAQTYQNLEIIVVDDGSKDGTPEILDKISGSDSRIIVIHKENGGVTSARFCGMEAATGEWIGFVDGDDYIEPEMYEVLIRNAKQYNADISHCGYQMVFPSRVDLYYGTGRFVEQDNLTGMEDLLEGTYIEPGLCNKLFRKKIIDDFVNKNIMDLSIKINEDLLMNFYLFREAEKSVYIDNCFYHYMVRKGSAATSKISPNKLYDPLKVQEILLEEVKNNQKLQLIVEQKKIRTLIKGATISVKRQEFFVEEFRSKTRKELRALLGSSLKGKYGIKLKVMVLWVAVWPGLYQWVHDVYANATGINRKYEVS